MEKDENVFIHQINNKTIILIGTAHISRESVLLVEKTINEEKPDTVCVELCKSRYQSIMQKDQWENMDIVKVIKEKKAYLLLSNLILSSFQKKIADKFDIKPGSEMIKAIDTANEIGAVIHLSDRDIRVTLARTFRKISIYQKFKLLTELLLSFGSFDDISEQDIEDMKKQDVLDNLLKEIGDSMPELRHILIDERDHYLTEKIRTAPGNKIVAVVGAGHVPGIQKNFDTKIDINELEKMPPKSKFSSFLKWAIPLSIICFIMLGFYKSGLSAGTHMIKWWIIANGSLSALGALLAFAHPITIVSAFIAAPLTSLSPMIAAGWVSGIVEAFINKPRVKDFQQLSEDISSFKGFWKNKITKILLVVVFTNIGSSVGTFLALPKMFEAI